MARKKIRVWEGSDGYSISDNGGWLPGAFATRRAAELTRRLSYQQLHDLWQRKGFAENGNDDGSTDYLLTEDDVREAIGR